MKKNEKKHKKTKKSQKINTIIILHFYEKNEKK